MKGGTGPSAASKTDAEATLWRQVTDAIADTLSSAEPGTRLESEAQQRDRYGVSRVTLRQALQYLRQKGVIESKPGLGWFVAGNQNHSTGPAQPSRDRRPIFEPPGKLMSFTDMARSRGLTPDSVVLEKTVRAATFEEAEMLGIVPGADVFLLRRLRRLNGLAIAIDRSLVPLAVLPNALAADFTKHSLHEAFRQAGAAPAIGETEVEAVAANEEQARLLEVDEGFPLLKVRQAYFDKTGRAIERGMIIYRSDRYRYRARLSA